MASSSVASGKENVLIRAGDCSVSLLPQFGGKISSIQFHGHELLQQPLAPIAPRTRTMTFEEGDASGWDECLPSVAACTVPTDAGPADIPDHGDLWGVAWESDQASSLQPDPVPNSIALRGTCFSLPLELERTLALTETPTGVHLAAQYKLTNTGSFPVPWSWAAHPLFTAAPGDRIVLPASIRSLRLEGSGGNRLGRNGDSVSWPIATLVDGISTDLSLAQPPDSAIGDKLFAGPLSAKENWCALERRSAGVRIRVGFDPAATPYLGLWICYGGWPDRPGTKQVCVALEPSTALVDSLAIAGPWSRTLAPLQSYCWPMHVDFEIL